MLVRDRMTTPAITVDPKTPIYDALALMKEKRIRRFPVVKGRRLVGVVTWTDLMRASPSPATSLTVWEIPYLLMKAPVAEVMTREVITMTPWDTVEDALLVLQKKRLGALPVVEGNRVVGIITKADVLAALRWGGNFEVPAEPQNAPRSTGAPPGCGGVGEGAEILDFLGTEEKHLNEIADRLAIPVPALLARLLDLELRKLLERLPGDYYKKMSHFQG